MDKGGIPEQAERVRSTIARQKDFESGSEQNERPFGRIGAVGDESKKSVFFFLGTLFLFSSQQKRKSVQRKAAFTLAEVLITLGVIGVVVAMTLPGLITNYREKARVTQLKKTYSILQQAYTMARAKHGDFKDWGLANTDTGQNDENNKRIYDYSGVHTVAEYFSENLKISKNKVSEKFDLYYLDGSRWTTFNPNSTSNSYVFLDDGSILIFSWVQEDSFDIQVVYPGCQKRGCRLGQDIFYFTPFENGTVVPKGDPALKTNTFEGQCRRNLHTSQQGRGCTAWVIYNENMDYLHCDDLSWDGKHKCK